VVTEVTEAVGYSMVTQA